MNDLELVAAIMMLVCAVSFTIGAVLWGLGL